MEWIPEQIVGIGEDFHNQVDDGKVKTTLCKRFVGEDMIERVIRWNPSRIYRDILHEFIDD